MKPLITIDIDDVLASTTDSIRLHVNEATGFALTKDDYSIPGKYWGYYESVWRNAGIDHLIDFSNISRQLVMDQFRIKPLYRAQEVLSSQTPKFRFALVTSRDDSWADATERWIERNFGDIFTGLYFTGDRHSDGYKNKGDLCKNLGAVLHIDDNVGHCQTVIDNGIRALLFGEYGWHEDKADGQAHCKDWQEVKEYLESYAV
jgi:5'(3')-deoxyribonucleotidase